VPDWPAEYAVLAAADRDAASDGGLSADALERLAVAAGLLGHDAEVVSLRERAIELYLAAGDGRAACLCGFWLGFHLESTGAMARASAWLERLERVAASSPDPWVVALFDQPRAVRLMYAGKPEPALELFSRAVESNRSLLAAAPAGWAAGGGPGVMDHFVLARLGQGRCLEMLGRSVEARSALDEVMLHVSARRVQPQVIGLAYCAMIELCRGWYDIERAREWTASLTDWVDEQAGMVPYRGTCLVHRAEFLQLSGQWAEAAAQADEACDRLRTASERAAGPAHYRIGELARLRGDLAGAEQAFERAGAVGHEVQPGLALLRMAQGRPDAALAGLDRAVAENRDPRALPDLLAARVEACLAGADVLAARQSLEQLTGLVAEDAAPFLRAVTSFATGSVLLAEGHPAEALPHVRDAFARWTALDARYEAATAQLVLARVCASLGDADSAAVAESSARRALEGLGAVVPAAGAAQGTPAPGTGASPGGARPRDCPLSPRELEVLRILATGATNRAIASALVLSEKTVARHVSNIFAKLGVASRAAATARAFEQHWA